MLRGVKLMDYKKIINSDEKKRQLYLENENFPPSIIAGLTNHCNLSCTFCAHSKMTRKKGYMALKDYKKIVNEIAEEDPYADFWQGFYGESLLLKYKLVYLISYAKRKGLKNVYINTNGILLNKELSEALIDSGLDKIVFSLDSYYEKTYLKLRRNENFEKVKTNILDFIDLKKQLNSNIRIEVQLIKYPKVQNKKEIEKFKEYWEKHDANVKIKEYVTWTSSINFEMRHKNRYPCSWLFRTMAITWNGDVAQCGCDYDAKFVAGNIKKNSIKEIWKGELKRIRDLHLEENYDKTLICGECKDWDSYIIMPFLKK
jgi:radical SAM protein with 4Fe4S-binding SPASM domain